MYREPIDYQIKKIFNDSRMGLKNLFSFDEKELGLAKEQIAGNVLVIFDDNISGGATLSDICAQFLSIGVKHIIPITFGKMFQQWGGAINKGFAKIYEPENGFVFGDNKTFVFNGRTFNTDQITNPMDAANIYRQTFGTYDKQGATELWNTWNNVKIKKKFPERGKEKRKMAIPNISIDFKVLTNNTFTLRELQFIQYYLANGGNATQAVVDAGFQNKAPDKYGGALLARDKIREEILAHIEQKKDELVAKPAEILQFYTSVMRGEVLDQFGIEASLDTRIKAANELAKHQIEIPLRLEQKNMSNNVGSITLNFLPRNEENV
jgi:phage terminase small subunit